VLKPDAIVGIWLSGAEGLEIRCANLDGRVKIDQAKAENKAECVVSSHQDSLDAVHETTPNSDLLTDYELPERFGFLTAEVGPEEFDFRVLQWQRLPIVSDNVKHSRGLQNSGTFARLDAHKEVGRKER